MLEDGLCTINETLENIKKNLDDKNKAYDKKERTDYIL